MASQTPSPPQPGELQSRLSMQLQYAREHQGAAAVPEGDGTGLPPAWCCTFRRFIAFLLDIVVLHALGRGLAKVAGDYLRPLGEDGWWVGIAIAAIYFAVMDSSLMGGKTVGKRLMRIEVRRCDGGLLSPVASLLRFIPIGLAAAGFFLWRTANPYLPLTWAIEGGTLLLLLGIGTFAIAHPRRQSLQDLLAGSVVVRSNRPFAFEPAGSGEPLIVFAALALLILLIAVPAKRAGITSAAGQQTAKLYATIGQRGDVAYPLVSIGVGVDDRWRPVFSAVVEACVRNPVLLADERRTADLARALAALVAESKIVPRAIPQITVRLRSGYDIGVWSEMMNASRSFPLSAVGAGPGALEPPSVIFKSTPGGSRARYLREKEAKLKGEQKDEKKTEGSPKPKSKPMLKTPLR